MSSGEHVGARDRSSFWGDLCEQTYLVCGFLLQFLENPHRLRLGSERHLGSRFVGFRR
jgi:hypothetical protein